MPRAVMVTGVARHLGARLARMLATDPEIDRVVGVDLIPPPYDIGTAEFVRADIRNPVIARVISRAAVDTVVHMNVLATPLDAGGRVPQKEINVIGTMQLLAACQKSPSVQKLVVKSSTTVYGASPKDPALFTEDVPPKVLPGSGYAKDSVEVEGYVRGFSRRRPDVTVTTLRFANFMGPTVRTPLTQYFMMPIIPTALGYDARLQFVQEDDGLAALRKATVEDRPGVFNIAGDGVLMLSQAIRRAGKIALPMVAPNAVGSIFRRLRLADFSPEQTSFLTYGRGVDTRRMREVFEFEPKHSTEEAFASFTEARCRGGVLDPGRLTRAEGFLSGLLTESGSGHA